MLGRLLGSVNKERALVYLRARDSGYAREIAKFFAVPLFPLQRALDSLEAAGVLISRDIGRTREYQFDPRYAAREELASLLDRTLELYPQPLRDSLLFQRRRPRRKGKPL